MGRKWTPEEREAASIRAKENIRIAKDAQNVANMDSHNSIDSPVPAEPTVTQEPPQLGQPVQLSQEQFQMMLDRLSSRPDDSSNPTLNPQGGVIGVIERFPIDPKYYSNPVEELYEMPELRRFGLRENYLIEWACTPTRYQTAMGTWYTEPRFELTLKRRQFDQDGNEIVKVKPDGSRFYPRIVMGRASFFEDPPANIVEAEQAGVKVEDLDKPEFQDKMRMYRYKFWVYEQLNPHRPQVNTNQRREEVIGGKVYEIDDYSKAA